MVSKIVLLSPFSEKFLTLSNYYSVAQANFVFVVICSAINQEFES